MKLKTNIREIVENYFEGKTSCKEETILRSYFTTTSNIPADLILYKPLFAYFEKEEKQFKLKRSFFHYSYFRIAAILLLTFFLGITGLLFFQKSIPNDYVIINGEKITDKQTIMIYVEKSLANLSDQNSEKDLLNSLNEFSTDNSNPQLLFSIFSN